MKNNAGTKNDRKKLSWTYRNKKRQGKIVKPQETVDNVQVQNKKARIIIRNLSFKVTEDDVRTLYQPFGQIEQINLLKRPDGKPVGCGFVQFKRIEDASRAIFKTNKQEFFGRSISSAWAVPKAKFIEQLDKKAEEAAIDTIDESVDDKSIEENHTSNHIDTQLIQHEQNQRRGKKKLTPQERKEQKEKIRKKRARIVIRNLSFKADEKILQEHFSQYGPIEEVQILTKSNGKRVGCGFVQFIDVQSAAKAVHYANMKPICDREVVVDFAIAKKKFATNEVEIKTEPVEIKEEPVDISEEDDTKEQIVTKNDSDTEENTDEESSEDEESDDENPVIKEEEEHKKVFSHDVTTEGKTVFLKNVPFSVKNDELRACMEQYGPVYYALICIDPLTEHSKGTAFVKFVNLEDAEKCLSAGTELRLHDQILDPHPALERNEVPDGKSIKSQRTKDTRNLYLVKEGVILAGTPAAIGVSAGDMAKRLQMEQWKSQMLRNLNMFVSRNRLVVHNLPESLDDATLRQIFKNHAGDKAVIQEARIMRDLKNPDANNVGKSKEFAFVAFTTHEDALRALRSINNNPNIFSAAKRPIVAFSIENRVMVNAKQRRVQKSRDHNPLWQGKRTHETPKEIADVQSTKRLKKSTHSTSIDSEIPEFSGITSKPGASAKLRSKFKLQSQVELHNQTRKNEKKQKKITRQIHTKKMQEQLSRKEIKPKQGTKKMNKDDKNFDKLVNSYKNKLTTLTPAKSKWYAT